MARMATPLQRQPAEEDGKKSDEINLTRFFTVLWRRWPEIVLVTLTTMLLTAGGVLLYRMFTKPVYAATATAAIVRTQTTIQLDSRFTTLPDDVVRTANVDSRRAALVALAKNDAIAQQVILELGDQLPPEKQNVYKLMESVDVKMATADERDRQSDLIDITARANSPELAAAIATAWVKAYVQLANSIYGQVPDDMLGSVEAQLEEVQAEYKLAQQELENFLASSQLGELNRRATAVSKTLDSLHQSRTAVFDATLNNLVTSYNNIVQGYLTAQVTNQMLAFDKEQEGQRARVASYFDAYNVAQIETFTQQSDRARNELSMYYQQWLRTNNLLASARALKEQAAGSETAASTALALQMLQLQMVNDANGGTPATGAGLQLQVDWATQIDANELRNQVDAAVTTLTSQLASLEQKITESSEALLSGDNFVGLNATMPLDSALVQAIAEAYPTLSQSGVFSNTELVDATASFVAAGQAQAAQYLNLVDNGVLPSDESLTAPLGQTIASLEDELRNLQRQLEVEQERSKQISRARDTAWESVTALDNKRTELQLARAAANSEVRLSSSAVPVDEPVARLSLALSLALAGIGGLMFGVALAFVLELTGVRPLRMARTTPAAAAA